MPRGSLSWKGRDRTGPPGWVGGFAFILRGPGTPEGFETESLRCGGKEGAEV